MAPTTTPSISMIGVLPVGPEHINVHRHPSGNITTLEVRGQTSSVLSMHIAGDTERDRSENLLAIAATIRQQALDLIAEQAPPVAAPGQWGSGMGTASTALRHASEQAIAS